MNSLILIILLILLFNLNEITFSTTTEESIDQPTRILRAPRPIDRPREYAYFDDTIRRYRIESRVDGFFLESNMLPSPNRVSMFTIDNPTHSCRRVGINLEFQLEDDNNNNDGDIFRDITENIKSIYLGKSQNVTSDIYVVELAILNDMFDDIFHNDSGIIEDAYSITIDHHVVKITSHSANGIIYGLHTFGQLLQFEEDTSLYKLCRLPIHIHDKPFKNHRAIHLDTSTKFIPTSKFINFINQMGTLKLNYLHWKPFDFRNAQQLDLFNNNNNNNVKNINNIDDKYKKNDIQLIINQLKINGIKLILEIPLFETIDIPNNSDKVIFNSAYNLNNSKINQTCLYILNPIDIEFNQTKEILNLFLSHFQNHDLNNLVYINIGEDKINYLDRLIACLSSMNESSLGNKNPIQYIEYLRENIVKYLREKGIELIIYPEERQNLYDLSFFDEKILIQHNHKSKSYKNIHKHPDQSIFTLEINEIIKERDKDVTREIWEYVYNDLKFIYEMPMWIGGEILMTSEWLDRQDYAIGPPAAALSERLWTNPNTLQSNAYLLEERIIKFNERNKLHAQQK
ncbi:hypothetical protein PPL_06464 [Heterostelium album PN500]|uniref:beta-N-acetylhexosaminidase n=1 Tax=Heterostelium pallidum (strain ATCC 26659 / Pp 5 / PN500) TaxID=670386 RepID=D3BD83_HETP5|nr:hypothetical protein PPL_06464 [Heterostelium album PN500]EFA80875.1 hypothetical protein PPL_06464 [Heterostelium album PN500]|eukprot:XP_020432994.1 hypothetical protein PPL_06464 [Heterostelium album PN500]